MSISIFRSFIVFYFIFRIILLLFHFYIDFNFNIV
nr:MAG TPA: hypothetical protein [Caudoviricetes sp.]